MNEGFTKALLPLLIPNVVFYLPEFLIDLFEALDERGVNVELKIVQCGFQGFQLFFDILQSSALKVLGLDLEAAMLVEVQKKNKAFKDLQQLLIQQIRQEYQKTSGGSVR